MEDLNRKFSFSEQIAIMLYKTSNKAVHYETYVLSQILAEFEYKYEYHQKTFEYSVRRHENMRAYFKLNENDTVEREYDENYSPRALPLVTIKDEATPEILDKIFFEFYDKNYSIEKLPGIKVLLVKATNGLFSLIRGHHCYLEVETAKILHRESIYLYKKIYESQGQISYEDATKDLPPLPKFTEYIQELHEDIKIKQPMISDFLTTALKNYVDVDKANAPVVGFDYFYDKFRIDIKDSQTEKFLKEYSIKPHHVFKALHQISISKILNTNIPLIFNVNSQRTEKWKNHYGCQAKNHPFYVEVDPERTFKEQIEYNDLKNREMLEVYGPLDAYMITAQGGKNFPVSQYVLNFVYNDESDIVFRPDLRKETKIETNYPMNIYFEIYYRTNEFFLAFYLSKIAAVSEEETLKMKNFLIETYNNLPNLWNTKIKNF